MVSYEMRLLWTVCFNRGILEPYKLIQTEECTFIINSSKSTGCGPPGAFKWIPLGPGQNEKQFNFTLISLRCRDVALQREL